MRDASGFPSARNVEALFGPFRSSSYRFRVDCGLDCDQRHVVLGPLFSTMGHSEPQFDQLGMKAIWKKWNYGCKNIK